MKKTLTTLAIILGIGITSLSAESKDPVNETIRTSFQKEFTNATDITWTALKDKSLFQVSFIYNNEKIQALFNEEGELLSTGRIISEQFLPIMVIKRLVGDYQAYKVRQVTEYSNTVETNYIATLYNAAETIQVRLSPEGTAQRIKRIKNKF